MHLTPLLNKNYTRCFSGNLGIAAQCGLGVACLLFVYSSRGSDVGKRPTSTNVPNPLKILSPAPRSLSLRPGWAAGDHRGGLSPLGASCSDLRRAEAFTHRWPQTQRLGRRWACTSSCGTKWAKGPPSRLHSWGPGAWGQRPATEGKHISHCGSQDASRSKM